MNIRMFKRTLVGEHMIKMISLFNEMKIFVAEIDGETKIEMILETLLTSFCQFKLNYTMNGMILSSSELMKEL